MKPCTRCGARRLLLAPIGEDRVCAACWKAAGCPFPAQPSPPTPESEAAIRDDMRERGGWERDRVLTGQT